MSRRWSPRHTLVAKTAAMVVIALACVLASPAAQRFSASADDCSCSQPSSDECPVHDLDKLQAWFHPCHNAQHAMVPRSSTGFAHTLYGIPLTIPQVLAESSHTIATPHPAPVAERPDAPS